MKSSDSEGFLGLRDGGKSSGGETPAQARRVRLGGRVKDLALGPSLLEALPGGVSARVQDRSVFYDLETVLRQKPDLNAISYLSSLLSAGEQGCWVISQA